MLEREVRVVLPLRRSQRETALDGPLPEPRVDVDEPPLDDLADALPVDRLVEQHHRVDDHQVARPIHVQPGGVGAREPGAHDVPPLRVEAVEHVGVLLVHQRALDLERRGQLAAGLGEVVVEDREALDLLDPRELRVDGVDLLLDLGADAGVGGDRRRVGRDPEPLGELAALVGVERQHRHEVRAVVAVDDRLGDVAAVAQALTRC